MKSILEEDPQLGRIVVVMMDLFFVVVELEEDSHVEVDFRILKDTKMIDLVVVAEDLIILIMKEK